MKKSRAQQLDHEIAAALRRSPRRHHHATTRQAGADDWDVAMDAIFEGDPKRAAQIARRIREEHPTKSATQEFSDALREAPQKVRDKFFELTESNEGLDFSDYEIGQMFEQRQGSSAESLIKAVLGDEPLYVRRFRLYGWGGEISALTDPKVAIRYHNELGIPTSKHAHTLRTEALKALKNRFNMEHSRMIKAGERAYGTNGPFISGGFHEDWPSTFKDKLRFLAHGTTEISDAIRLHQALSKTRSPAFS